MKITRSYLKQVIKEELSRVINEQAGSDTMTGEELEQVAQNAIAKGAKNAGDQLAKGNFNPQEHYVIKNNVFAKTFDIISSRGYESLVKQNYDARGKESDLSRRVGEFAAARLPYEAVNSLMKFGLKTS